LINSGKSEKYFIGSHSAAAIFFKSVPQMLPVGLVSRNSWLRM